LDPAFGSLYFSRTYTKIYPGNPLIDTLQPYLISILDGDIIKFIVQTELGIAVPNINIDISKMVSGSKTLVASGITDSSGEFSTPLILASTYYFDLFYNGSQISKYSNFFLQINESKYYFTVSIEYDVNNYTSYPVTVLWVPGTEYLYGTSLLTQSITGLEVSYVDVNIVQYTGPDGNIKTVKAQARYDCTGSCSISQNIGLLINPDRNLPLYVELIIYRDNNTVLLHTGKRYKMQVTGTTDLLQLLFNARSSFGCEIVDVNGTGINPLDPRYPCAWTTVISIALAIFAIGGMIFTIKIINPYAMGMIGILVIIFFTIAGWFYWPLLFIFGILLVLGLYGKRGSE